MTSNGNDMNQLERYRRRSIPLENDACETCPIHLNNQEDGTSCFKSGAYRYDREGIVTDVLDPVDVAVYCGPPTSGDVSSGRLMSDPTGKDILKTLKEIPKVNSIMVIPAVRCAVGNIEYNVLNRGLRQEKADQYGRELRILPVDKATDALPHCSEYATRIRQHVRSHMDLVMGPLASEGIGLGKNIHNLRSHGFKQRKGFGAVKKGNGTLFTWDRHSAKEALHNAYSMQEDIEDKVPCLFRTGYTTPYGRHKNCEIVTLDSIPLVERFVDRCLSGKSVGGYLAIDYEAASLSMDPSKNQIINVGMAFTEDPHKSYVIPYQHPETPFSPDELVQVESLLKRLLSAEGLITDGFVAHNAQFEVGITKSHLGVWLGEKGDKYILDTMIMAYLNCENRRAYGIHRPYALATLAKEMLGFLWYEKSGMKEKRASLIEQPIADVNEYVGMDAIVTARLFNYLVWQAEYEGSEDDLMRMSKNLYSEAIKYTMDMHLNGQEVDVDLLMMVRSRDSSIVTRLKEIKQAFSESKKVKRALMILNKRKSDKVSNVARSIFKASTSNKVTVIDLNSPEHRRVLFWNVLKLDGADKSVDAKFQERHMNEPLVALFQEYQKLSKLDNAYLKPMAETIQTSADGRVHPSFNLTKSTSGRLSASDPNCFDEETEILTDKGWIGFPSLEDTDVVAQWWPETDTIDFVVPNEVVKLPYDGEMVVIKNDHIDLVVTPNHRCPVASPETDNVKVFRADDYPSGSKQWKQLHSTHWHGGTMSFNDEEIDLLCEVHIWLAEEVVSPEWVMALDRETLLRFVKHINTRHASRTRGNADAVQIALTLCGIRSNVSQPPESGTWLVSQKERPFSWASDVSTYNEPSNGMVYCVSVPSSYILVRRNGKVCISGQTQQIPRGDTRDKKHIKSLYTTKPENIMVQLDFSQAEVRWLGILSGDKNLADRYRRAEELGDALRNDPTNKELQRSVKIEGDLHMSTAIDMYGIDPDTVVNDQGDHTKSAKLKRQAAKSVCFGLIYGKHYKSLAKDLGITDEESADAVDKWLGQFPQAAEWLVNVDNTIGKTQVARSPFGRWRRLHGASSSDISVANRAKRQARNTPIQSAASDFCIFAACKLRRALLNHENPKVREIMLINTVHDSVAAEVPNDPDVVLEYMELSASIFTDPNLIEEAFGVVATVPLKVDFDIGANWGNVEGATQHRDDIVRILENAQVLRDQPTGTLMGDLAGTGLLK